MVIKMVVSVSLLVSEILDTRPLFFPLEILWIILLHTASSE